MTSMLSRTCRKCGTTDGPFIPKANLCVVCKRTIERERAAGKKELRSAQMRAWREANRETLAASKAAYHRRNQERIVAYVRDWREKNKDECNARRVAKRVRKRFPRSVLLRDHPDAEWRTMYARALGKRRHARERIKNVAHSRAYYQKNKATWLERNREWRRANRERYQIMIANRRARRKSAGAAMLSVAEWRQVLTAYGHSCAYCGTQASITLDHATPLSRGGEHTQENVVPACRWCNGSKNARTPLEWFMGIPRPFRQRRRAA